MIPHFYMDTNILVALLSEEQKTESVKQALDVILNLSGGALFTSQFAFIEAAKVLVNSKKVSPAETNRKIRRVTTNSEIEGFPFEIVPATQSPTYSFDEFFRDVGDAMNLYNPGWGDAFHIVIMRNNRLENILSTDEKEDFQIVSGLRLFHPEQLLEGS